MDDAYSAVLGFLPAGLKGLSIAALTAAIVASLAGKINSISTIFTLDIYKKYINKEASEYKMVWTGRAVAFGCLNTGDPVYLERRAGYQQRRWLHLYPEIYRVHKSGCICHVHPGHVLEKNNWRCSSCRCDYRR